MIGFGFAPMFERVYSRKSNGEYLKERETKPTIKKVKRVFSGLNELVPSEMNVLKNISPKTVTSNEVTEGERKVRFSKKDRVVLVPAREDFRACGLDEKLFYKQKDYPVFEKEAKEEILNYVKQVKRITQQDISMKKAVKELYQPSYPRAYVPMHESQLAPH